MGLVSLDEEAYDIQIFDNNGVEGNLIITEDRGVEGIPKTFISDSVLMVGRS
jgi:hypothetical protein